MSPHTYYQNTYKQPRTSARNAHGAESRAGGGAGGTMHFAARCVAGAAGQAPRPALPPVGQGTELVLAQIDAHIRI